jgi:hypothetical protein
MEKRQCNIPGCTKNAAPGKRKCWAHVKAKYRADKKAKEVCTCEYTSGWTQDVGGVPECNYCGKRVANPYSDRNS